MNNVNTKMTALADEVRTLSGTTNPMGIDTMTSTLHMENTNFENNLTEQNDLISQIATLVATKANPQSGADVSGVTATPSDVLSGKKFVDSAGTLQTGTIATKTSSNLTASGATVTVPAGYYASQATKSISSGSAEIPATTITTNPTISINSIGKITASVSGTQSVTPTVNAGYVSSGTAGTITISGSATKQLTTKATTTYIPTISDQTIERGTYLAGTQTIKGDANLKAENIKSGVSIFGVFGSYEGSGSGGSSSGGSVETCNVTFACDAPAMGSVTIYYTNGNLSSSTHEFDIMSGTSITVAKNTLINVIPWSSMSSANGDCVTITQSYAGGGSYVINGDSTITYE